MTSKRFLGLDGLRGVCALTVLFYHCSNFFHKGPIFLHGFLAVDMFFILSGFVIALTYEERLRNGAGKRDFLFSRARRLFPTYWLGAAFNIVVFVGIALSGYIAFQDTWWMIWVFIPLTTLLVIPDYITPDGMLYPAMDSVAWSLFLEWIAYGVYASGVFRWRTSYLVLAAFGGWALMASFGIWSGLGWSGGGDRATLLTIGTLRCLPAFAAGIVIYRLHNHPIFRRLPEISTEVLLALWLCIAAVPRATATPVVDAAIVMVLSPLLVCLLIRSDCKAPSWCKQLGGISYPLYVVHPAFIVLATYTPMFGLLHGPRPLNGFLVVGLCIALAWLVMEIVARISRSRTVRTHDLAGVGSGTTSLLPLN
ncbi:MAG: acyltransferase family protein [Rhizomicrobium sp.]